MTPGSLARIAIVPGTPLLIPAVASGAAVELDDVRAASIARVAWAAGDTGHVTVLAQDPSATHVSRVELPESIDLGALGLHLDVRAGLERLPASGPGTDRQGSSAQFVPVSVLVAAWLAQAAGVRIDAAWSVPTDPAMGEWSGDVAGTEGLLLIADGSCTRTAKAPGSFVEGAVEFDDRLAAAIKEVDTGYLTDPARGADAHLFGAQGLGVWSVGASLVAGSSAHWLGAIDLTADPYGVNYLVAGWSLDS